jgi:hypothetical protein
MKKAISGFAIFAAGVAVGIYINQNYFSQPSVAQNINIMPEREPDSLVPPAAEKILEAPTFKHAGALRSDVNGQVYVAWTSSEGAMAYEVNVFDRNGANVKTLTIKRNITSIKGLYVNPREKMTPYKLQVTPIGENDVRGTPSEFKDVAMLPLRNLAPPEIKSITAE